MEKPAKEAEKYLDLDTGNEEEKKKSNEEGRSINESFSFSESVITVKSSSTLSIGAADEEQAKKETIDYIDSMYDVYPERNKES